MNELMKLAREGYMSGLEGFSASILEDFVEVMTSDRFTDDEKAIACSNAVMILKGKLGA